MKKIIGKDDIKKIDLLSLCGKVLSIYSPSAINLIYQNPFPFCSDV